MADHEVRLRAITVYPHAQADRLEIGQIDGYQVVVGKGQFASGDIVAYIPEASVLPPALIASMGLEGKLAGAQHDRVKAIKLRGILSQGLVLPVAEVAGLAEEGWTVGLDVAALLGVTKYEPPIPIEMQGDVTPAPGGIWRSYDVEDIKKFPHALRDGEWVSMSEKVHGSLLVAHYGRSTGLSIASKGLASKGLALKPSDTNVYWRAARQEKLEAKLREALTLLDLPEIMLFGEVVGVQDLRYGHAQGRVSLRAFDAYGSFDAVAGDEVLPAPRFANPTPFAILMDRLGIPAVPIVYAGPFSAAALAEATTGQSALASHIREGVVIRPGQERRDDESGLGRVILKSVSPDYLLRRGGTEYN